MSNLYHENNVVDEDDKVIYNLMEDVRCLKEDIARLEQQRAPFCACGDQVTDEGAVCVNCAIDLQLMNWKDG